MSWKIVRIEEDEFGCEEPQDIFTVVYLEAEDGTRQRVRIPEQDARALREQMTVAYVNKKILPV